MKAPRYLSLLAALAMLFFVIACGTMEPDTEPIPAFPGAETLSGDDSFVVGILEDMSGQLVSDEDFEATTAFYSLPADASFDEVVDFYEEELSGRDWTRYEEEPEIPDGGMAGWERGRNQAFFVMVMPDELSGLTVMMTMEAVR